MSRPLEITEHDLDMWNYLGGIVYDGDIHIGCDVRVIGDVYAEGSVVAEGDMIAREIWAREGIGTEREIEDGGPRYVEGRKVLGDILVTGDLYVAGTLYVDGRIRAGKNAHAGGDVVANKLESEYTYVDTSSCVPLTD